MSLKRAGQSLLPQLTRGFRSSAARSAGQESGLTHEKIAMGDGHHGLRPGYNYVSAWAEQQGCRKEQV